MHPTPWTLTSAAMDIQHTPDRVFIRTDGASGVINNSHLGGPYSLGRAFAQGFLEGLSKDGAHGVHAPPAQPGAPGCNISVDLKPLHNRGISVQVIQPAARTPIEVAGGKLLQLSSCGGDGAEGGRGGDGAKGKRGRDGTHADQYTDATDGSRGGNGGDAGNGSHGGAGGDGGMIEIFVDDQDTNLLSAVYAESRGGRGGDAGENGMPGKGGDGGRGGDGYEWSQFAGRDDNNTEIYVRKSRPPGNGGRGGKSGRLSSFVPLPGPGGRAGEIKWVVRYPGQGPLVYPSRYDFRLEGFQLSDENNDGVFEPGEHVFVHNIRVTNVGGMPTPSSWDIPVAISPTPWLSVAGATVSEKQRTLFLPRSIQPGETVTLVGSLKAMIQPPTAPSVNQSLRIKQELKLQVTMPGLEMQLPGFQYAIQFEIKYPVEVTLDANNLTAAPQNSQLKCTWRITNNSNQPLGHDSPSKRRVIVGAIGKSHLTLYQPSPSSGPNVSRELSFIPPSSTITLTEHATISPTAPTYSKTIIDIAVLLTPPPLPSFPLLEPKEVQLARHTIQVATRYVYQQDSDYLLLANNSVNGDHINQFTNFVKSHLNSNVDTWNVSLYGGLSLPTLINTSIPGQPILEGQNVLDAYPGKTIVMFGNAFSFFEHGERRIWQLCDPIKMHNLLRRGSQLVILAPEGFDNAGCRKWLDGVVFPPAVKEGDGDVFKAYDTTRPTELKSVKHLVKTLKHRLIKQQPEPNPQASSTHVYTLPPPCVLPGLSKPKALHRLATKTQKQLRRLFPGERFLIIPRLDPMKLMLLHGTSHHTRIHLIPLTTRSIPSYPIIASLSLTRRLQLQNPELYFPSSSTTSATEKKNISLISSTCTLDPETRDNIAASITTTLATELTRFLSTAAWPDTLVPRFSSSPSVDAFLQTHLPALSRFLSFHSSSPSPSPTLIPPLLTLLTPPPPRINLITLFRRDARARKFILAAVKQRFPVLEIVGEPRGVRDDGVVAVEGKVMGEGEWRGREEMGGRGRERGGREGVGGRGAVWERLIVGVGE
ncbi:hypothetical protein EX30DRAFT_364049 [Ascodesmis nigricans]|uniref:DUF7932 domain-containing protein n=1 Tax=Ascodesmis nigricans TaxID=341454 RepID=A0A4S2MWQ8_9PEZI|nr:hypothetical protein EX30DRAFT_364049 [Ascodesmis nigricans]